MNWNQLTDIHQLDKIAEDSHRIPQLIFKHSTRCFISATVLRRLESEWNSAALPIDTHFLDLLTYRSISDHITERLRVVHESPQVIILDKGKISFHASHDAISVESIAASIEK